MEEERIREQELLLAQRLDKRNISRRRFLLAGLTAGAALALGAGASLFLSPGEREFSLGNNSSIRTVAWSPNGYAFAAGGSDAGHVVIWRASDGQELTSLPIMRYATVWSVAWSPTSYFAVAWSPDGKYLLSGDYAGRVLLWAVR